LRSGSSPSSRALSLFFFFVSGGAVPALVSSYGGNLLFDAFPVGFSPFFFVGLRREFRVEEASPFFLPPSLRKIPSPVSKPIGLAEVSILSRFLFGIDVVFEQAEGRKDSFWFSLHPNLKVWCVVGRILFCVFRVFSMLDVPR